MNKSKQMCRREFVEYIISNLKKKRKLYRITSYLGIMNKLINCYLYRAQNIEFIRNE